ncbi:MAG: hypothetical protein ACRC8Y_24950 [Chroococcales cyanobacterium]
MSRLLAWQFSSQVLQVCVEIVGAVADFFMPPDLDWDGTLPEIAGGMKRGIPPR